MLLGFVVLACNIEANPKKISAIMDMGPIKNLKGVQWVTGCLTTLSRFIVQTYEEVRLLHVDPRSTRGARLSQEHAQ
jgi:hypothetical protein